MALFLSAGGTVSSQSSSDDHHERQFELGDDDQLISLRKAWDRALRTLAGKLNSRNVDNFLKPLRPVSYDGSIVVLGAPSAFAREWAEKKYGQQIKEVLEPLLDRSKIQIRIVILKPEAAPVLGEIPAPPPVNAASPRHRCDAPAPAHTESKNPFFNELAATRLTEKYTFETYVTGKSNRLAQAGAVAVANAPGTKYNPLFLYGTPGLGKTHLMHAIGHHIRCTRPDLMVACISGETFTNHFVASLRDNRSEDFRRAYRHVDVLLVDDIHTIATREQTKEEFFHTFNALHQLSKQIVITSDRSPRELRTMDERLRSRFESGLIADVAPPELDMRKQILIQKAARENLRISEDVIEYMANLIQSNIRALEGALIKLMAYASLVKSPVTKQLASDVLSSYFLERMPSPGGGRPVSLAGASVDQVVETVAIQLSIDRDLILATGNRSKDVMFARAVAMYLCREITKAPTTTIAKTFGCRNHSAITHAHDRLEAALQTDPQLLATVNTIRKVIEYSM